MAQSTKENSHRFSSDEFMTEVKRRIESVEELGTPLTLIALDFDDFNYVNDLYGYEIGDGVLEQISCHFEEILGDDDIFCRLHADHFLICLKTGEAAVASQTFTRLTNLKHSLTDFLPQHYTFTASGGILIVRDKNLPLSALVDRANCARKLSKGTAVNMYHIYDEKMNEDAQWRKQVTCMMEGALTDREFEMYLQPKVLLKTGEIIGAEALVRWKSPSYGMIFPDRFIPILEQNGFIRRLDFFMLEEACHFLQTAEKQGEKQLPISVNFSKSHLRTEKLVERIFETVNRHGISANFIEIEFTENMFSENTERLIEIISDLKLLGFRVSIDDFGSAYSSLNYLKDLPVDIIKIDKGFLDSSTDTDRGKVVIAKVVELIKSLRMMPIMEGVETEEQVEFLQKLSCDIGQGYFYAKPMSKEEYLCFLKKGTVLEEIEGYFESSDIQESNPSYLNAIPQEFQMDNWELYTLGKNIDMGLIKGYLDGVTSVQYINDRALEYLGYNRQEFREIFHNSMEAFTHPEDRGVLRENTRKLIATGKPLQFNIRAIRKDGKVIVLQGRSSCVLDDRGRPVGIYAFQDVTEELERTAALQGELEDKIKELEETVIQEQKSKEALRLSEEGYRIIVEQSGDIMFEWDFILDIITFSDKYKDLFGREPHGTIGGSKNPDMRRYVHPEDKENFETWVSNTYSKSGCSEAAFRVADARGTYLWMTCRSTAICNKQGVPIKTVGIFTSIQEQRELMDELKNRARLDPLTGLLNKTECQNQIDIYLKNEPKESGALFMIDVDDFKDINDNLGHQLGDRILQEISTNIRIAFPETDMIGRIGGDEFVVFLHNMSPKLISEKAEVLTNILRLSYFGSISKYEISGSIGVAISPKHGNNFNDLYRYADIALYHAKNNGKNCCVVYEESIISDLQDNRTPVEYSQNFVNSYFKNDITFQIFAMLYETKDVSATVSMLLELLGKWFGVDRVYIFERVEGGKYLCNTYEWCAPDITSQKDNLQKIPMEDLTGYFEAYSKEGVFCCEDIECSVPAVYELCAPQGIRSLLHCAIYDAGVNIGFIGFDYCSHRHSWTGDEIALLGYISRVLSIFMIKNVVTNQLKTSYQNYAGMVENLNGFVYVIDPDTFEVLFVNRAMRELGLESGKLCFDMAYGSDCQCENCPLRQMDENTSYATSEVYSEVLKGWVNTAASKMKWGEDKDTVLVCCTDISKYRK